MLSEDKLISENKFLEKENSDLLGTINTLKEEINLLKCEITTLKIARDNLKEENITLKKEASIRLQLFEGLIAEKFKLEDKIKELEAYNKILKEDREKFYDEEYLDDLDEILKNF